MTKAHIGAGMNARYEEPRTNEVKIPRLQGYSQPSAYQSTDEKPENSNERQVTDPITGKDITIKDSQADFKRAICETQVYVPTGAVKNGYIPDGKSWVGLTGRSNFLLYPFPQADWGEHQNGILKIVERNFVFAFIAILVILLCRWQHFISGTALLLSIFYFGSRTLAALRLHHATNIHNLETSRANENTATQLPESVEWLNRLVRRVWPIVNPEVVASMTDLLEDVMQASIPSIIHSVKIADLSQGKQPVRILSICGLPSEGDDINVEVSFAYYARKNAGIHLVVHFFVGFRNLVGIPLPVWVDILGALGTARLRIKTTPNPPFFSDVTLSFMGLPNIEMAASPLNQVFMNVMDLPLLSNFIKNSLNAAANEYVAPRSYTVDVCKILVGDDVKRVTSSVGIIYVQLKLAKAVEKADRLHSSDPYIIVTLSKFNKPLYSTRIITDDLNPIWEESAFIPISLSVVKANENLSVEIWDSDRFSNDDLLGRTSIPIKQLIERRGEMQQRVDGLIGYNASTNKKGKLVWSVGYFGLQPLNPKLSTTGQSPFINEHIESQLNLPKPSHYRKFKLASEDDEEVRYIKPDPNFPSGILAIQIHQAVDLGMNDTIHTYQKRQSFEAGQDLDGPDEEDGSSAPSSYCNVIINDQIVFRTREKAFSRRPFYNAGTERFIRNWKTCVIMVNVRHSIMREHDTLIGVIYLKLADVFANSSLVTEFYPLAGGLGYGRVRVSLLFRSVEMKLMPKELGWEIGTIHLNRLLVRSVHNLRMKLRLRTISSKYQVDVTSATGTEDGGVEYNFDEAIQLPVRRRFSSALIVEFYTSRKPVAVAIIWLIQIYDHDNAVIEVPIYWAEHYEKLTQNFIVSKDVAASLGMESIGSLHAFLYFQTGLGLSHSKFASTNSDIRQVQQAWRATVNSGVREHGGDFVRASDAKHGSDQTRSTSKSSMDNDQFEKEAMKMRNRGTRSLKAVRQMEWVRDGAKLAGHNFKRSLELKKTDEPRIETEV